MEKRHGLLSWGVAASVGLHLAIAVALLVQLPDPVPEPEQEEETVTVEIVPPPEEPPPPEQAQPEPEKPAEQQPAPPPPEQPAAEEPKPEEAQRGQQAAEPAPEPPAEQQQVAQAEQVQPEPPPPPAEEKAQEPPPEQQAPEQPAPEQAAAEEPPAPEAPQPQEQAAEQQSEAPARGEAGGSPSLLEILKPVFAFGETDAGPREDTGGNAAEDTETADATAEEQPQDANEAAPEQQAEAAKAPEVAEMPPAQALPSDINLPEANLATTLPEGAPAASDQQGEAILMPTDKPSPEPNPDPKPTELAELAPPKGMKGVKRLFSESASGDAMATTAMGNMPRDQRADQLCVTELREQLRHATPAYRPELLPSYKLKQGNVLEVSRAAFRADRKWYDLRFRCEVNGDATRVLSFGFSVGEPIPRSEWRKRGFPDF